MSIQCKECGEVLEQKEGKRKREFCDSTCRSNFWQKEQRKKKEVVVKNLNKTTTTTKQTEKKAAQNESINTVGIFEKLLADAKSGQLNMEELYKAKLPLFQQDLIMRKNITK